MHALTKRTFLSRENSGQALIRPFRDCFFCAVMVPSKMHEMEMLDLGGNGERRVGRMVIKSQSPWTNLKDHYRLDESALLQECFM